MFNSNARSQVNSIYRFIQVSFTQQILSACHIPAVGIYLYTAELVVCSWGLHSTRESRWIVGNEPAIIMQNTVCAGEWLAVEHFGKHKAGLWGQGDCPGRSDWCPSRRTAGLSQLVEDGLGSFYFYNFIPWANCRKFKKLWDYVVFNEHCSSNIE